MIQKISVVLLWWVIWYGLFFWWGNEQIQYKSPSIESNNFPWSVLDIDGDKQILSQITQSDAKNQKITEWKLLNYQNDKILMYGRGILPDIANQGNVSNITIQDGVWILRSLDVEKKIIIQSPLWGLEIDWLWWAFIDLNTKNIINFDAKVKMSPEGGSIEPSFYKNSEGKMLFYDFGTDTEIIPKDLQDFYTALLTKQIHSTFFPGIPFDENTADYAKNNLDTLIKYLISREPAWVGGKFFKQDMRAKNLLLEMEVILKKIHSYESCGASKDDCMIALEKKMNEGMMLFPQVFSTMKDAISVWMLMNTGKYTFRTDWIDIFRTYHMQRIQRNFLANSIRDKSILEMVKNGKSDESYAIWGFLTKMLASQNLGSTYSMKIVKEMLRMSDILSKSNTVTEIQKSTLITESLEGLQNVKNLLENTYFIKKNYWYVLRTDLLDNEWKPLSTDILTDDLNGIINQVDSSILFLSAIPDEKEKLWLIRAQLVWFKCIFEKNEAYVNNPRICRITNKDS